jgi:hypothetical protein
MIVVVWWKKRPTSHEDRNTFFFGSSLSLSLSLSLAVLEIKIAKKKKKKKKKLFFLPGHKLDAERILSQKKKKTLLNSCSCSSFVQVCLCCCNLGKLMIGREGEKGRGREGKGREGKL